MSGRASSLIAFGRGTFHWWLNELADLFPGSLWHWLTDPGIRNVVIKPGSPSASLYLRDSRQRILDEKKVESTAELHDALEALLKPHSVNRNQVQLGLALPTDAFFCREIRLPREVGDKFAEIAWNDLLHQTPLRAEDIYYDYNLEFSDQHILVRQYVIKRSLVHETVSDTGFDVSDVAYVEAQTTLDSSRSFRLRLLQVQNHKSWQIFALLLLGTSVLALFLAAATVTYRNQTHQLDNLHAQIDALQSKAQAVRTAIDDIQQEQQIQNALESQKQGMLSLLDVWEDVSQLLPDDSWVQEFRFVKPGGDAGYQLTLSGLSASAARLVEVLDRSPRFSDVRLTAPISVDPVEKQERFVLETAIHLQ